MELLSFEGCEAYFYSGGEWNGKTFGQVQFHFPDGVPVGIVNGDGMRLNPDVSTVLSGRDSLVIIAEDDSTIRYLPKPVATPAERTIPGHRRERVRERELILGWSPEARTVPETL